MRFTIDVTSGLVFGHDLNTMEEQGDVIQQHLDKLFPAIGRQTHIPIPYIGDGSDCPRIASWTRP